jgi:hypothetical protein
VSDDPSERRLTNPSRVCEDVGLMERLMVFEDVSEGGLRACGDGGLAEAASV